MQRTFRGILRRAWRYVAPDRQVELPHQEEAHRWARSIEYARRGWAVWHRAYEACHESFAPPLAISESAPLMLARLTPQFPELGVLEIPFGALHGPAGWVVGRSGCLLPEHSWYGTELEHMPLPGSWGEAAAVGGTCLSLASDWSDGNYGHFMLDALPRLHLFERAGFSWDEIDHIYCPAIERDRERVKGWLARYGVPLERCDLMPFSGNEGRRFDRLLAPSFPGLKRNYPRWVANFLRRASSAENPSPKAKRRLYVTRKGGIRQVSNEQHILPILEKYGFEYFNPLDHTEPWKVFEHAGCIVGAHGAGLTDIAFCPPEAAVLELLPSDHQYPYYCALAQSAGLRYAYLLCESASSRGAGAWGPSQADIVVDPQELENGLRWISMKLE